MSAPIVRAVATACVGCVSLLGLDFKAADVLIAVSAAALVRVPLFKPKGRVISELSFTALGAIGAFAIVVDNQYGPGKSFCTGIVLGAAASSLLEVGKSAFIGAIQDRLQAAGKTLFGIK